MKIVNRQKSSNIIQLLERMGQDASLQSTAEFQQVVSESTLSKDLKQSLLNKDIISLEKQLDTCPDVYCAFLAPEDDESIENPYSIVA